MCTDVTFRADLELDQDALAALAHPFDGPLPPASPLLVIVGGVKLFKGMDLIMGLLSRTDIMIIGGGLALKFLSVIYKMPIGQSKYDRKATPYVKRIVQKAQNKGVTILLPVRCYLKMSESQVVRLTRKSFSGPCLAIPTTQRKSASGKRS